MILFAASLMMACSNEEKKEESGDKKSTEKKEEVKEEIEESITLEIENFINDTTQGKSIGKLPQEFNNFDYSTTGALYDKNSKTLSIYFANFENPEQQYGMCCGLTKEEGQKTMSFIIKHDDAGEVDREQSFINYTNTEKFMGLNMVDRTMNGSYEMHDNYVEGEFIYTNDVDSSAFIKTTFKLNLKQAK